MMINIKGVCLLVAITLGSLFVLNSCGRSGTYKPTAFDPGGESVKTGIRYNTSEKSRKGKSKKGADENSMVIAPFLGQPDPPGMVYIEGGRVVLGSFEEDLLKSMDNIERTVSVSSFYMDETEIGNIHWLEYLHHLSDSGGQQSYEEALPDTTVWAKELAFNDPYVDHYLRYPGFRFFPVVGVSWLQASEYCVWRTIQVNNILAKTSNDDELEAKAEAGERIPLESGVVLPSFRLPTEAEWEYAAQALIGLQEIDEMYSNRRIYPWDGHSLRNPYGEEMGNFLANFKRGRGDYAGIGGELNDAAMITDWIYGNPPNDFGLFNMAGNVSEWVEDVYRPLSFQDIEDLNPVRKDGFLDDTDWDYIYDKAGYTTFIGNDARVYKGGSWKDVAYWMAPGTRRYLEQDSATATIGFRCAMIRAGKNY